MAKNTVSGVPPRLFGACTVVSSKAATINTPTNAANQPVAARGVQNSNAPMGASSDHATTAPELA